MQAVIKIETNLLYAGMQIEAAVIEKAVSDITGVLGIHAGIELSVDNAGDDLLKINGTLCLYPDTLYREIKERPGNREEETTAVQVEFVSRIIWLQPQVLFPATLLAEYMPAKAHDDVDSTGATASLREIIDEMLSLGIPVGDHLLIKEKVEQYRAQAPVDYNGLREDLIESLSVFEIGLYISESYFHKVFTAPSDRNMFTLVRDALFYETGIQYPDFKIRFENTLPDACFYFTVNSYRSLLYRGLPPDKILVNDTTDRLQLYGINNSIPAINPASGLRHSIVNGSEEHTAKSNGFTTWNMLGYFSLCLTGFLRTQGYRCVGRTLVSDYLNRLEYEFPAIIELIRKQNLENILIRTLRLLAREQISIRNLPLILEAVSESDCIVADGHTRIIFDERIPVLNGFESNWKNDAGNVAEYVRVKMKRYISHKCTRGQATLAVYLLDPKIERLLDPGTTPVDKKETQKDVLAAVDAEIGSVVAPSATVVLTTVNIRPHFRKLIEQRFPYLDVISYQELSPELNIQPVARIGLKTGEI
ncbi:MAG: FHIPEP family type III secretion protein [Chitinophagaceae bacterium]|nr:FHIPEP family type III secretion protein [Chitinophagaceae bacterium]MCW5926442.1 FHIPEP family type III secretion protein [Chitinophagaceae bacterium]